MSTFCMMEGDSWKYIARQDGVIEKFPFYISKKKLNLMEYVNFENLF